MTSFRLAKVTYSAKEIFHQQIFSVAISYFKANHSKIVLDIYQTAHVMFSDKSQGDHKQHAKYRFASKTLMRILPPDLSKEMEQKEKSEEVKQEESKEVEHEESKEVKQEKSKEVKK